MAFSLPVSLTAQTGFTITTGGPAVTGLKAGKRTFSLTGAMGTALKQGDVVQLWGSNDGGVSYQPLRQGAANVVQLTFTNPEIIIDDCCDHYATQRTSVGTGSTLAAVGLNGDAAQTPLVQSGTATLVLGTVTVTGVILSTASSILLSMRDSGGGVLTTFIEFSAPVAARNVAAGSFRIDALDNAKAVLPTALCTVDWAIIG